MVDVKVTPNDRVTVTLVPVIGIANYKSPTAGELNAGTTINASPAIAWEGSTLPTTSESDDVDDRSITDKGNATSRGSAQYEGTLNLFHPRDKTDMTNPASVVYDFLRTPGVHVYAIVRVLQKGPEEAYAAGEWISVYRFLTDGWEDDIEGDDSYKYSVSMLTQGEVIAYTQVKNSGSITVTNTGSSSLSIGEVRALRAVMGGHRATQVVDWKSSAPAVATISPNGVVKALTAGSATITAEHPAATTSTGLSLTIS